MTGNAEYDAYCFGTRYIDFVARLEAQFGEAMTGPDLYKDLPLEGLAAHDWSICRKVSPAAPCQSYRRRTRRTMKYPVEGFDEIQFIAEDDTAKLASGRLDDTSVWSIHTSYRKCAWKVVLAPTAR
jgi:hypothetical protein